MYKRKVNTSRVVVMGEAMWRRTCLVEDKRKSLARVFGIEGDGRIRYGLYFSIFHISSFD